MLAKFRESETQYVQLFYFFFWMEKGLLIQNQNVSKAGAYVVPAGLGLALEQIEVMDSKSCLLHPSASIVS